MIKKSSTSTAALAALVLCAAAPFTLPAATMSKADIAELRKAALEVIQPIPDKMPGSENDTKALVSLGEKLYFEKKLSMNNSQSCNSCHRVDQGLGGVDNEATSPGAFGKRGGRNSPTTLNAGFQFAQFWDGRAATLEDQAKGPVLNPIEMAMPSEAVVIERLTADKDYVKLFKGAFPKDAQPINYDNYAKAVGAFERTLITRDRFDDFLKGGDKALTAPELAGLKTFLETGCTTCHNGPVVGGNSFMKLGLVNPYPSEDKGRQEVTKDADDHHKFKVPMLRNIAITGPYFHDGSIKTLNEAVEKMAWHQLGQKLEKEKVDSIVTFLGSLTDKKRKGPKGAGAE
jgi:cytochrome c peroxidase